MCNTRHRGYTQQRHLIVTSGAVPRRVTIAPVRERWVPRLEIAERLWWAVSEALNSDDEPSYNGLGTYPAELAALYVALRDSLRRFAPRDTRLASVVDHASRWRIRVRDVEDSLRLAHIGESTDPSFTRPHLQMPLVAYGANEGSDLVPVGPQHADPARLITLARRRVRKTKGWTFQQITDAEGASNWRVVQAGLKAWRCSIARYRRLLRVSDVTGGLRRGGTTPCATAEARR